MGSGFRRMLTVAALAAAASTAEACTSQEMLDKACRMHNTDAYTAARDVATTAIDQELWTVHDQVVEVGTGVLLQEMYYRDVTEWDGGDGEDGFGIDHKTVADFERIIDRRSLPSHGVDLDGNEIPSDTRNVTIREHMRAHVKEVHDSLGLKKRSPRTPVEPPPPPAVTDTEPQDPDPEPEPVPTAQDPVPTPEPGLIHHAG